MEILSNDLIKEVCKLSTCSSIQNLMKTCKQFFNILSNQDFWENKSQTEFSKLYSNWRQHTYFQKYSEYKFYIFLYSQENVTYGSEQFKSHDLCLTRSIKFELVDLEEHFKDKMHTSHSLESIKQLVKHDRISEVMVLLTQLVCDLTDVQVNLRRCRIWTPNLKTKHFRKLLKFLSEIGNDVLISYVLKCAKAYHAYNESNWTGYMSQTPKRAMPFKEALPAYRAAIIKGSLFNEVMFQMYVTEISPIKLGINFLGKFEYTKFGKRRNYLWDIAYTSAKNGKAKFLCDLLNICNKSTKYDTSRIYSRMYEKANSGALRGNQPDVRHVVGLDMCNVKTVLPRFFTKYTQKLITSGKIKEFEDNSPQPLIQDMLKDVFIKKKHWDRLTEFPTLSQDFFVHHKKFEKSGHEDVVRFILTLPGNIKM